jgi:hypothetical protein
VGGRIGACTGGIDKVSVNRMDIDKLQIS